MGFFDYLGMGTNSYTNDIGNVRLGNSGQLDWNLGNQINQHNGQSYGQWLASQGDAVNGNPMTNAVMQQAGDQLMNQQMALAHSMRGGAAAGANRLAMQNAALGQQGIAQQGALTGLQEQQQKAQQAMAFRGQNDSYAQYLYGLGNQRDMNAANVQLGALKAAGEQNQKDMDRRANTMSSFGKAIAGAGMF